MRRALPRVIAFAVVFALLWLARDSLVGIALAGAIAYLVSGPVDRVSRYVPRGLAILVVFAGLGLAVYAAFASGVPLVAAQIALLADRLPAYAKDAAVRVGELRASLGAAGILTPELQEAIDAGISDLANVVATGARAVATSVVLGAFRFALFVFGLIIALTWAFYGLRDSRAIGDALAHNGLVPAQDIRNAARLANAIIGRWLRVQILLMSAVGVTTTLGIVVLGATAVPSLGSYALALGLFAGLTELFPIVGPIVGATPAVLIAFAADPLGALWVALLYTAIQQLESLLLVPKLMGTALSLHPVVVILGLVIGSAVFGIPGAALAAPLVALGRSLVIYSEARLVNVEEDEALARALAGSGALSRSRTRGRHDEDGAARTEKH